MENPFDYIRQEREEEKWRVEHMLRQQQEESARERLQEDEAARNKREKLIQPYSDIVVNVLEQLRDALDPSAKAQLHWVFEDRYLVESNLIWGEWSIKRQPYQKYEEKLVTVLLEFDNGKPIHYICKRPGYITVSKKSFLRTKTEEVEKYEPIKAELNRDDLVRALKLLFMAEKLDVA